MTPIRPASIVLLAVFSVSCSNKAPENDKQPTSHDSQSKPSSIPAHVATAGTGDSYSSRPCVTSDNPSIPDRSITCSICYGAPEHGAKYQNMICRDGKIQRVGACKFPTSGSCEHPRQVICDPYRSKDHDPDGSRIAFLGETVCFAIGGGNYQLAKCVGDGSFATPPGVDDGDSIVRGNDGRCKIKFGPAPEAGRDDLYH
ncbi:hypothetical protein EDF57_10668 [Novosphingobium sp. PhB55]|nr:hypothetical protein EDF57_10668 [Novosphingobium sp. PhB55]